MRSRIYGITKDVVIICFFIAFFFALTHNPIVRPKPLIINGTWTIELHQKPLALGVAGHNYLVLRDETGTIIATLHGLPTDRNTGEWKYVGRSKEDILKVWDFTKEDNNELSKGSYGVSLLSTTPDDAIARWNSAQACGEIINQKYIPYPPFGVSLRKDTENSNSVAYTLASCMNLRTSHVGLFTPGWGKNLIESTE